MRVVCAWCGALIRTVPEDAHFAALQDSHGICEQCAGGMLEHLSVPVDQFLSELGVPVLVVDGDVRVLDANPAALSLLGQARDSVLGRMGGQVFECTNARLPEGCGRTVHCSGCVLRQTVTSTWETGQAHRRVPATLEVSAEDGPARIAFLVSTARVGSRVVLRVDPPAEEGAEKEGG